MSTLSSVHLVQRQLRSLDNDVADNGTDYDTGDNTTIDYSDYDTGIITLDTISTNVLL